MRQKCVTRTAAADIGNYAEILVHPHVGAGFLDRLAPGCGDRFFIRLEFALGQNPGVISPALDDGDERPCAGADDDAAGSHDGRAHRLSHSAFIADSKARAERHAGCAL
jgi:hypothetical protein